MEASSFIMDESSSIGEAVSGRGDGASDEDVDEDLYYIPERRPSLDLGPTQMDTSTWYAQALSPVESYSSMASEGSTQEMPHESFTGVELKRADSFSSCYSFDSDDCEKKKKKVKDKEKVSESSEKLELIQDPNEISHPSLTLKFTFKAICDTLKKLSEEELKTFRWNLWTYYPQSFTFIERMNAADIVDIADRLVDKFRYELSVQITRTVLVKMRKNKVADHLLALCKRNEVRYELCKILKEKYYEIKEERIDDIYTNLCILESGDYGPNTEHEILTIGPLNTKRKDAKQILLTEFLSPNMLEQCHVRLMLLTGVAGSGKSTLVRKLVCDWVEERSHQHFDFVLPFSLRDLNQFEGSKISMHEIIHKLYPPTKKLRSEDLNSDDVQILFIFDGLDEYNKKLDFAEAEIISDPKCPTSLDVLMVNLLRDRLLFRAMSLLTSRPQVRACFPWDTHYYEMEVRGFGNADKDEYFKKRFKDQNQAARAIEHVKSLKTLHIMCHLPLFCKLVAAELQKTFENPGPGAEMHSNVTYFYTKLLLSLIHDYHKGGELREQEFLFQLGKLAFDMLEKDQFRIAKIEWPHISIEEAVVSSGLCTEYTIKPYVLFSEKVVSFIHPTMQEYLAAFYAYLSFKNKDNTVFDQKKRPKISLKGHNMGLYKSAVDRSVQCDDGKLDLFLRFLFGMIHRKNQELLKPILKFSAKVDNFTKEAASIIKEKINENQHPNRNSNLQRCLEELGASV